MSLTNVEIKQKDYGLIIIDNMLKLFKRRNYINDLDSVRKDVIEEDKDGITQLIPMNTSIKIKSDKDKSEYLVYISSSKINSITQNSTIDEFLRNNLENKKFLITSDPSKKVFKQVYDGYPNSELFSHDEFLEDIPSKLIIPEHRLLGDEERNELLTHYELKHFKRINEFDMMSRYYGAKPNDVFRIDRANITSGKGIDYRVVVPGKIDFMY